jgi:hypothetical protein
MERTKRKETLQLLKDKGYKLIKQYPCLYLSECGNIYDLNAGKELKPDSKNKVCIDNKRVNVCKLLLLIFKNEPIRKNGHVCFIDGNNKNLHYSNIAYQRKYCNEQEKEINPADLCTTIRCYFEVSTKYNVQ